MYNLDIALTNALEKDTNNVTNYIEAGIHENVKLTEVKVEDSPNGNKFMQFLFKKANVGSVPHTEWEPKKFENESDESFKAKGDRQFGRIVQILLCYFTAEELKSSITVDGKQKDFSSFSELANWTIDLIQKADLEKGLRVKFIYNDKDFVSLPKYVKFTFIEPMTVSAENSAIRVLGIDKMKRSIVADNESIAASLFESTPVVSTITSNNDASELPF